MKMLEWLRSHAHDNEFFVETKGGLRVRGRISVPDDTDFLVVESDLITRVPFDAISAVVEVPPGAVAPELQALLDSTANRGQRTP